MAKQFLYKNHKESNFHPELSEYLEILAWDLQGNFPYNFRGLAANFSDEYPKEVYHVNYIWIEREIGGNKLRLRDEINRQLYPIRETVKGIGVVDEGIELQGVSGSNITFLKILEEEKNLRNQFCFKLLEEKVINNSSIFHENIFFYKTRNDHNSLFYAKDKEWEKSIKSASEFVERFAHIIDPVANKVTKVLAFESLKNRLSLLLKEDEYYKNLIF